MKYYKVPEDRLLTLLSAYYELQALNSGGVDNWSWYSEAKNDWLKEVAPEGLSEEELWDYRFEDFAADMIVLRYEEIKENDY
jgi:hypothetical protein